MDDALRLKVYEAVAGPAEELEWSGTRQGQGYGPHGSGGDGDEYDACPVCGGLREPNGEFVAEAVGHQPGCTLADLIGAKTRPAGPGRAGGDRAVTVLTCVSDRRHGWIGSWETEPLVLDQLTPEDVGRTVVYVDETKPFARRAEAGTLVRWNRVHRIAWARYDTGDTAAGASAKALCFGVRPLDGDLER